MLTQLGAIDERGITARGKAMLRLPTHPRIAHLLLEASEETDTEGAKSRAVNSFAALAADLAALLEERDPLAKESGADLALRVEALRKWRAGERVYADRGVLERINKLAANWRRLLRVDEDNTIPHDTQVGRLLVAAYPERIARQQEKHSERYKLANGRFFRLPQHDPLMRESWLCVAQLDGGGGEGKIFMAAAVHHQDL